MSKVVSNPTRRNQATTSEVTGFIRQKKLLQEYVPFSAATLWRLVKVGRFPQPIKIANQITVWRTSEILVWVQDPESYFINSRKRGAI
jgi:prophage regulatory protein